MNSSNLIAVSCAVGLAVVGDVRAAGVGTYRYESAGQIYGYSVVETGDNFTFDFERSPGLENSRIRAVGHVFRSVYDDDSVTPSFSEAFMKEGANCFMFDARFYTYKTCFLPNDSKSERRNRFWGYVSRLPNFWWFLTRNILPGVALLALLFLPKRLPRFNG